MKINKREIRKKTIDLRNTLTRKEISQKTKLASKAVSAQLKQLEKYHIIDKVETTTKNLKELAYQPAMDPANLSVSFIIDKLDKRGHNKIHAGDTKELHVISEIINSFYDDLNKSSKNKILREL